METVMTTTIKKMGRKPIADKKMVVRLFIETSIINANGGEQACKDKCVQFLKKTAISKKL
jgi:hypothetical protein